MGSTGRKAGDSAAKAGVDENDLRQASLRLTEAEIAEADQMARTEDRSMGVFIRRTYLLGLAVVKAELPGREQARARAMESVRALAQAQG